MSSRLRPCLTNYEDQSVAIHIENVERRLRLMCRAMQHCVGHEEDNVSSSREAMSNVFGYLEIFHEYVDHQMDQLKELREILDKEFEWISITGLRAGQDF
ncbi:hypothetical protein [Ensifer soli]|uniref:hypothetical protein n=1 Tax=Ciceribacter sp. sgz301302 TaxID=3342379 RepID=UPI0035B9EC76